jgi:hypothetical protein
MLSIRYIHCWGGYVEISSEEDIPMINRKLTICVIFSISMFIAILCFVNTSARDVEAKAIAQANQIAVESMSISQLYKISIAASVAITNSVFLPVVDSNWSSPCGGLPFLISPSDGSHVTSQTQLVLDGGYRGGNFDWLEYEFSETPDFTTSSSAYLQPAGKHWELMLGNYGLEPGVWYWRASVWCSGPGWPPPPNGYTRSPFSEVWSFILD